MDIYIYIWRTTPCVGLFLSHESHVVHQGAAPWGAHAVGASHCHQFLKTPLIVVVCVTNNGY